MKVISLTRDNYDSEVLNSDRPVLIDFWASWCHPCMMLSPVVDEIAEDMADKLKVVKVNVDEQPELANRFNVSSIPTLVLMEKGQKKTALTGYRPKESLIKGLGL